ncbi:MAG: hypothetical protein HC922_08305 [Leptolyngbyaceae cyanobacterium SM2_3_12]|nr:hypothetical protein [Leptolyngbyaceae cyanobacterium SM2_3_12]
MAIAVPAQALNIDFSSAPWESIGNVSFPATGEADLSTENGADAVFSPALQDFLGLAPTDLDLNNFDTAFVGSALKRQVVAGD